MKPKSIKALSSEELAKLSTPRLLSFLRKLQQCEESLEQSDYLPEEVSGISGIIFKSSDEWLEQYHLVTSILNDRPHIQEQ